MKTYYIHQHLFLDGMGFNSFILVMMRAASCSDAGSTFYNPSSGPRSLIRGISCPDGGQKLPFGETFWHSLHELRGEPLSDSSQCGKFKWEPLVAAFAEGKVVRHCLVETADLQQSLYTAVTSSPRWVTANYIFSPWGSADYSFQPVVSKTQPFPSTCTAPTGGAWFVWADHSCLLLCRHLLGFLSSLTVPVSFRKRNYCISFWLISQCIDETSNLPPYLGVSIQSILH